MVDVLFLSLLLLVLDHIIAKDNDIYIYAYIYAYIFQVYITTVDVSI